LEVADHGAHIGVVALVFQVAPCKILYVLGALLKPMYSYDAVSHVNSDRKVACFHYIGLFFRTKFFVNLVEIAIDGSAVACTLELGFLVSAAINSSLPLCGNERKVYTRSQLQSLRIDSTSSVKAGVRWSWSASSAGM
jgi:hypothetical protein